MNNDFRITTDALDHPKLIKLKRIHGPDGVLCLIRLWGFTARYHCNGILENMNDEDIEIACQWNGHMCDFIKTLLDLRLLDKNKSVYSIHNWEDRNGYAIHADARSEQARRAADMRWAKRNGHANDADSNAQSNADSNAPSPNPNPNPNPNPEPEPEPLPSPKEKLPSEKEIKMAADSRQITDLYQKFYIERFNRKPAWGKQEGKRVRELLERYSLEDVLKIIEIIFTVPDELISPHLGTFRSCLSDKFCDRALTLKGGNGKPKPIKREMWSSAAPGTKSEEIDNEDYVSAE